MLGETGLGHSDRDSNENAARLAAMGPGWRVYMVNGRVVGEKELGSGEAR